VPYFSTDSKAPISAGFYRLEPGTPLVYEYTYHEMKIIVSGSFDIADETGKKVHATAGDVFYFPKGAKITFTTEEGGLAFYVSAMAGFRIDWICGADIATDWPAEGGNGVKGMNCDGCRRIRDDGADRANVPGCRNTWLGSNGLPPR
jgi:Ethanolamine utilisation protein EutQ